MLGRERSGVLPLLDLEDGHMDVLAPHLTPVRKSAARRVILDLCHRGRGSGKAVGLRVNSPGTEAFEQDLETVRAVSDAFKLTAVLVPKISSPEEFQFAESALRVQAVAPGQLYPMVETKAGLERADEIARAAGRIGAAGLAFGYHDYCLDAGLWPFPETGERAYWAAARPIATAAVRQGLRYVSPPVPALRETGGIRELLHRLGWLCGEPFDVLSAGPSQTALYLREFAVGRGGHSAVGPPPEPEDKEIAEEERKRLAVETCRLYEANRRPEHSFSADSRSGLFLSPHQYLAAKRYLTEREHA